MKQLVNFVIYTLFFTFIVLLFMLFINVFIEKWNFEVLQNVIVPLATVCIPVMASRYFEDKTDMENLNRSLDMLERHRKNCCMDEYGNKIEDGTMTSGYVAEYNFIVNNWDKYPYEILELAKENCYLQKKEEGPEEWAKNHFLGKDFNKKHILCISFK